MNGFGQDNELCRYEPKIVIDQQKSCILFIYMLQSKQIASLANSQFILGALIEQDSRMIQFHTEQMREEASFRN